MPDEELKLTVTLVDNATPQLGRIRGPMHQLGGSDLHGGLRRSHEHIKNLGELIHKSNPDLEHLSKHLIPDFILGMGGVATVILGAGIAARAAADCIDSPSLS
jgi:hypothetical protein